MLQNVSVVCVRRDNTRCLRVIIFYRMSFSDYLVLSFVAHFFRQVFVAFLKAFKLMIFKKRLKLDFSICCQVTTMYDAILSFVLSD